MEALALSSAPYQFIIQNNILLASWHDSLSSESEEFMLSVEDMFAVATEQNIKHVLIDSGVPAGGTLTLEVINIAQKKIQDLELEKIALLESSDFYWDNNLFQFLQYLQSFLNLKFELQMFGSKEKALAWLQKSE